MNAIVDKPKVQPRVEAERQSRRRRTDLGDGRLRNLAVTGTLDPNYKYRWINDEPGRVYSLTKTDDWDPVNASEMDERNDKDKAVGTNIERIVDRATGKRAILVRKPIDYYVEDRAKAQAQIDALEAAMKQGRPMSPDGLAGPEAYVPSGGISIKPNRR